MARKSREVSEKGEQRRDVYAPISSLREEVDRLFDDFSMNWPFAGARRAGLLSRLRGGTFGEGAPDVDVIDREKSFEVRAELPGVEEKDIDLRVVDDALVLKAEKRETREEGEEGGDYYVSECRYGSFQRVIPLPATVDASEPDASFRKGVLTVKFPKRPETHEQSRRIEVRSS